MSNVSTVRLFKLKSQNLGLGELALKLKAARFGFPLNWHVSCQRYFVFKQRDETNFSALVRVEKALKEEVLLHPLVYNNSLQKRILRRIEFLRLNRSWRGVRHSCSLPTRGQRTKTNARTRKSKRRGL